MLVKMSLKVITILLLVLTVKTINTQQPPTQLQGLLGIVVDGVVDLVSQVLLAVLGGLSPPPAGNDCFVLKNGTQYYIKSADGRFAVVDTTKRLAFLQISDIGASQFTAVARSCNVFGFCANGFCMSRCEGCTSDSEDFETVSFHPDNSDGGYSQWTLTSAATGGPYVLQIDNKSFLTYKQTAAGDQLTLATEVSDKTIFSIVQVN